MDWFWLAVGGLGLVIGWWVVWFGGLVSAWLRIRRDIEHDEHIRLDNLIGAVFWLWWRSGFLHWWWGRRRRR